MGLGTGGVTVEHGRRGSGTIGLCRGRVLEPSSAERCEEEDDHWVLLVSEGEWPAGLGGLLAGCEQELEETKNGLGPF